MKLAQALKKFSFLKRLSIPDKTKERLAVHLSRTLIGDAEVYATPLAKSADPIQMLYEWDQIYNKRMHELNAPLRELERSNRLKFGPRSIAVPWSQRLPGLRASYQCQDPNHIAKINLEYGEGLLYPISLEKAIGECKMNTSAGLPFLQKKGKSTKALLEDFDGHLNRKDPCMLYTRTTENKKTRNVWGYPFADTVYEMMFYIPVLKYQKTRWNRAALISPDAVAQAITELIINAMSSDKVLYSVDFAGFDASIKYQYIIRAFDYIKSLFATAFHPMITYVCNRMYTIGIVTPTGIYHGIHGVPSGSTFTNEVDSIVQFGIASTCPFIHENECQVQGDDGVYIMTHENIAQFEAAFQYAGLKLEKSKSIIANDHVIFCQNLYHIDYMKDNFIGGIYPTYRALNRILFQERFVEFGKSNINGSDYFGIRCLSILENCKHHPLFEDLVRFILSKEKHKLDISDDGLVKYCEMLNLNRRNVINLNHQYGTQVMGIKGFASYQVAKRILADEEFITTDTCVCPGEVTVMID